MRLPKRFYDEIVAHTFEGNPNEVCGLIAGAGGRAVKLWRTTNNDPNPRVRYNVDPVELLGILREIEDNGWSLMAIYHSHPASQPYPSATDIGLAYYPDAVYIIASLIVPSAARGGGWRTSILPFVTTATWSATLVAVWSFLSAVRGAGGPPLRRLSRRRPRGPAARIRGLAALLGLAAASFGLARLSRPAPVGRATVRAYRIVDGRVTEEVLEIDRTPPMDAAIERGEKFERSIR